MLVGGAVCRRCCPALVVRACLQRRSPLSIGSRLSIQFPTGLRGNPPNLDVALWLHSGEVWGIESKFTEPFGAQKRGPAFKDKYFPNGLPIWNGRGLPKCGILAAALRDGGHNVPASRCCPTAQARSWASGQSPRSLHANHPGRFTLCYFYVDHDDSEAELHGSEIAEFAAAVAGDFPFVSLSYTTLLKQLRSRADRDHDAYFAYIPRRYGFEAI
jgi:hypothetical protein